MSGRARQFLIGGFLGNHRTLIMGFIGVAAGVMGTVFGISDGAGVGEILSFLGIGTLGLLVVIGSVYALVIRSKGQSHYR
ncbi:hypothetical protein ACF1A9_25215 [Streptomyces sp. NPDC014872]|uniref:hypothetical protein n=1 Tax=Streptomyces sp. NPDC014872 TaxID=3364926 RepID=UPI0036F719B7